MEEDPDLDPIEETAVPILSDSELSDVDEEAYAGIDTNRIGLESDEEEGPSVFSLKPAKLKSGTGERKARRAEEQEEKRRRREERRREKEERSKRKAELKAFEQEQEEFEDVNKRPDDPEAARRWDLDRAMDAAISRKPVKRRKKDDEIDLENLEEEKIGNLKSAMEQAAEKDAVAIENKIPATNKLTLLPTVEAILAKSSLHETILDKLLLVTIRQWLEPLPDRSLPAFSIQRTLLTALQRLPITKEHLAESGIGKIVIFYRNSQRVEPSIRKLADALWVEWSRPILKKSADFHDRQVATASYDPTMAMPVLKRYATEESKRTVIPRAIHSTFSVAPKVNINLPYVSTSSNRRGEVDTYKKLKQKLAAKASKPKREGGVSIQGGGR